MIGSTSWGLTLGARWVGWFAQSTSAPEQTEQVTPPQGVIDLDPGPGWLRAMFEPHLEVAGARIGLDELLVFGAIVVVAYFASRVLQRVVDRWFELRRLGDRGVLQNTNRLIHYVAVTLGVAFGLHTIGINLGALFAAGAVLAVAIGFATQNLTQNFVSGVLLLAERSITEGDILNVEGSMVRVERLGARATVARTRDDEQLIIPNAALVQSTVTNFTLEDDLFRVRAAVGVSYDEDLDHVAEVLERVGLDIPDRSKVRDPIVLILEFAASAIVFELSVWSRDPWTTRATRSEMLLRIWRALRDEGITIAYPQLDLHVKSDASSERGERANQRANRAEGTA